MIERRKLAIGAAGIAAVAAIAAPLGLTSGSGSIDVFVGSTPTATATATSCTGADVTTATFAARFSAATAGNVLCLSQTADYGNLTGGAKTSPGVTVMAKPGAGVTPLLTLQFENANNAAWITFDGIEIGGGRSTICAPAHNITVKNAEVSNQLQVLGGDACPGSSTDFNNNAIVFDNTIWTMDEDPTGAGLSADGRLEILRQNDGSTASGILVKNSRFTGNCADGIQTNTGGWTVQDSEFDHLIFKSVTPAINCAPHVDSIQFYRGGGPYGMNTLITGNYFHDNSSGVVVYNNPGTSPSGFDQTNGVAITNSVFDNIPFYKPENICDAICIANGTNWTVTHVSFWRDATLQNGDVGYPSTGTTLRDSIITSGSQTNPTGGSFTALNHNYCTSGTCTGTGSLSGAPAPSWVGGTNPSTFAGFALTASSRGTGVASDSTNIGVNP